MLATEKMKLLRRPSGAFAMLAIDQRESMRAMFQATQAEPVRDEQLVDFKLAGIRALSPYASAVLIDRQFGWRRAVDEKAVAPSCRLIAAADRFIASAEEFVADVEIDEQVVPAEMKKDGAVALKLLVTWRPDESADARRALVQDFIARCRAADLVSLIEPVSRKPRDGRTWDTNAGIVEAARELGGLGADIYKSEVPHHGQGGERLVRQGCAELTKHIRSPWVVLSSGVPPDEFPRAVQWACQEGAAGFLAGRAVWRNCIGSPDIERALREDAVPRLQRLCDVVDGIVAR